MEQETAGKIHGANASPPNSPPVSATEQLAQLTLDTMPGWMKAPGGFQRFRAMIAIGVIISAIILGVFIYRQAEQIDSAISSHHAT